MTATEVVSRVSISAIWQALGGDPPRRGRARAFYRETADAPDSVSLNDEKGVWYDFRDGQGGGVLDLVQRVRGVTRAEALRWVAAVSGIELEPMLRSPSKKRQFAELKRRAEGLAQRCMWWARGHAIEMERVKADAFEQEDMTTLAWASSELYWFQCASPSTILARFLKALKDSPTEVAALIEMGREDEENAVLIAATLVMGLREVGHA